MRVVALYGPRDMREEEWPRPDPGPGEVRVKVKSVCICGSDTTQFETAGIGGLNTPVPFILGHEAAGIVDATGTGVTTLLEGMPVAIEPDIPCGECEWCRSGRQNVCPNVSFLGAPPVHGALREYIIMPAENLFPVKAKVSFAEIACIEPLAIGIYTARKMNIKIGDTVAIFGAGGIGQVCLIAALQAGARVICVTDRVASRREVAENYGAENTLNCDEVDAAEAIKELTNGRGVDIAIEAAGEQGALSDAIKSTVIGGSVAIVGIPHEAEWKLPAPAARRSELTIRNIRRSLHATETAVEWVERGVVDLSGLVSNRIEWEFAEDAYKKACACEEGTLRISLEPEELEEPFHA